MKNSTLKTILVIVGSVVVLATITVAIIHFWDDIKKYIPFVNRKEELEDFDDIEV